MGRLRRYWTAPGLVTLGLACASCGAGGGPSQATAPSPAPTASPAVAGVPLPSAASEDALLDAVFRIDIQQVEVTFDLYPAERRAQALAAVTFRMRPGQPRPIVHFGPAGIASGVALRLDGEDLDPARTADARLFTYSGSGQVSLELQRDLAPDGRHRLEASYPVAFSDPGGRFFADVNDIEGRGNEALFPTLNTPRELAHHVLVFRVHAGEPYLAVGSGRLTAAPAGGVQEWTLDTEREVASYGVMFHLAPASTHLLSERRIHDADVGVLAATGGVSAEEAFSILDPWLAELQGGLGPFPMPRGLAVVLTQTGRRHHHLAAHIVSARSAPAVGFDRRAYDQGALVIQAVAVGSGGRGWMLEFLRDLHARRSFDPFTTWGLADEIQAWSGVSFHERFRGWRYSSPAAAAAAPPRSPWDWLHQVDLGLPPGGPLPRR